MGEDLASLEATAREYKLQLETVQSSLLADPENAGLQELIRDLEEVISLTESAIAELKPASAPPSSRLQKAPPSERNDPPVEKWSKEKHPAYQAGYKPPNAPTSPTVEDTPVVFSVNDPVLAKWKSGDKSFYPARITSITGSSTNPVYIVTFKNYATTETLRASDLKAIANPSNQSNKRKADGPSTTPTGSSQSNNGGGVISKGANIDESLVGQAKREPSKVSDGPIRPAKIPRKVKANKELEQGKNNWQKFSANPKKWKAGVGKKDSMFRTGEGVNARVGFTGSGQEMRKDQTRSRHIYDQDGEEDY